MLAVPIEENPARKNDESLYDENLDKILECLSHAEKLGADPRMMQVRITAFVLGSAISLIFFFISLLIMWTLGDCQFGFAGSFVVTPGDAIINQLLSSCVVYL